MESVDGGERWWRVLLEEDNQADFDSCFLLFESSISPRLTVRSPLMLWLYRTCAVCLPSNHHYTLTRSISSAIFASSRTSEEERQLSRITFYRLSVAYPNRYLA